MLSYSLLPFCLLAISVAANVEIDSKYMGIAAEKQYNNYQIVNREKVDLKVYYESLCPGCRSFHTGTLHNTYKKLGPYIDLKTYPYGNAERTDDDGKTTITCQHGEAECYGNKLHACAIDVLKNVASSEGYISCMMTCTWGGEGSTDMDATKCGQEMKIDPQPVIDCAKSQRGEDLLEYYGKETDKLFNKKFVPWVLLDGKLFHIDDDDLMKAICKALSNPPPECK